MYHSVEVQDRYIGREGFTQWLFSSSRLLLMIGKSLENFPFVADYKTTSLFSIPKKAWHTTTVLTSGLEPRQ